MRLDLNADLGEGFGTWSFGTDDQLLSIVSSANVACGFHAGDPTIMRQVLRVAATREVRIGAHVSYPDLPGFGRRAMEIPPGELEDLVAYQVAALVGLARAEGTAVRYVKPHGALYNRIVRDETQAAAVAAGVAAVDPELALMGLPRSAIRAASEQRGLPFIPEAFADRAYTPTGELVPRSEPGAVLHDSAEIAERVVRLATAHEVVAVDGGVVPIDAESVCVHGDSPGAVAIAAAVRDALEHAGVEVGPPAGEPGSVSR